MVAAKKPRATARKLAPAVAVEAEAVEEGVTFEFRGIEFTTLPALDMSIEILEATEEGNGLKAVRLMVGDEEWQKFKALNPTLRDLTEFSEALSTAAGLGDDSGN